MLSIRNEYAKQGIEEFYKNNGSTYSNPHEYIIHKCLGHAISNWFIPLDTVLDLACGSGEITSQILYYTKNVVGVDPYTFDAYYNRIGKYPLLYSFEDIANGIMKDHHFDIIICSFALHLIEKSRLPGVCYALSQISDKLLIITPNKKPTISWFWELKQEKIIDRVRIRLYEKT